MTKVFDRHSGTPYYCQSMRKKSRQLDFVINKHKEDYQAWLDAVREWLLAESGRVTQLAMTLCVHKHNVADWFTLQRANPPAWVIWTVFHTVLIDPKLKVKPSLQPLQRKG